MNGVTISWRFFRVGSRTKVCEVVLQPENFFHSLSDRNVKEILGPNDWRAEKLEPRVILANSFDCTWELGEILVS